MGGMGRILRGTSSLERLGRLICIMEKVEPGVSLIENDRRRNVRKLRTIGPQRAVKMTVGPPAPAGSLPATCAPA